jgi:peptidoglycan L-alanyl-D-glutamate endopeptidase CwlK
MKLSERSIARLDGVHPDLVRVVYRAAEIATDDDFVVTEGVRTVERQRTLLAKGASKTMRSRHIPASNQCGLGCAVDLAALVDGKVEWSWPLYDRLAVLMKEAAKIEGVSIQWGGDWLKFKDGPHFQLSEKVYPYA